MGPPSPRHARAVLAGRGSECARLDQLLADARRGQSGGLVLRGEPGIGKSALLEYAAEHAEDCRVLRATGVEWEMELPFAGVHQLCAGLLDGRHRLPAPQRDALATAFGLSLGVQPDRFLVGLAVLSLLSDAAEDHALVCLIDDAQWLDRSSVEMLAFVARRLRAESIVFLFAEREPGGHAELGGLPELRLGGLADASARELFASVTTAPLDERVRDRILAEARGNPLALLELAKGLTVTGLAGNFGLPEAQGVPGRIEQSFARRIGMLSRDARQLLLVAAAEPVGDPLLLWRAAKQLAVGPATADDVQAQGLLTLGERVTFRHPLVRSAVYRSAAAEDRRAVHLALAAATDREADPDRRAWHLAAGTDGPDERIARELERSASRAQARGGMAATAAFLQRSVTLTQDPGLRADRALAAAEAAFQAGAFDAALRMVASAEASPLDERQLARVELVRGHIAFTSGLSRDALPLVLKAARRLERSAPELARETYLTAWGAATVAPAQPDGGAMLVEISHAIRDLPRRPGTPRPLDLLLEGLALLTTDGHAAATPVLQRAARSLAKIPVEDVLRWGWMATAASNAVWDNDGAYAISARQVQLVRSAGALAQLPLYLSALGLASAWTGDLAEAASVMEEADTVAAATGGATVPWTALRLRALEGREAEATAVIASAIQQAAQGAENLAVYAHWAAAVLYNGLAYYEKAAAAARQASSNAFEYWVSVWALPELVEATARLGDTESASIALERLVETTQPSANDFALGLEARCRALLSSGTTAERLYREAIERLARTQLRPELARAHLLFGEWLRRDRRRLDAREELRAAQLMFTEIGMQAFAERTRKELLATGETARKRTDETRDELTAQERQIAQFARDGLSNADIGARLFISPRTVEYHLHKVFSKLGITSRQHLDRVLPGT